MNKVAMMNEENLGKSLIRMGIWRTDMVDHQNQVLVMMFGNETP